MESQSNLESANVKNSVLQIPKTINSRGRILSLSKPLVMGILNATPDSFYNKGKEFSLDKLFQLAEKMIAEGADILDIGGASSRPGAEEVSIVEEMKRALPAIEGIRKKFPKIWLSIDTTHHQVAQAAIEAGADIINDISGGHADKDMLPTAANLQVPYIAMHMKGTPQNMTRMTSYEDPLIDLIEYFKIILEKTRGLGLKDLILDPGFGFAKTQKHNYLLLKNLQVFQMLGCPILVGVSRKTMIYKTLDITPEEALNATTVLNTLALEKGANILRVHDVKEAVEVVKLWELTNQ